MRLSWVEVRITRLGSTQILFFLKSVQTSKPSNRLAPYNESHNFRKNGVFCALALALLLAQFSALVRTMNIMLKNLSSYVPLLKGHDIDFLSVMHIRYAWFSNFVPGLQCAHSRPIFSWIVLQTQAIRKLMSLFLHNLFTYTYMDVALAKLPALDAF